MDGAAEPELSPTPTDCPKDKSSPKISSHALLGMTLRSVPSARLGMVPKATPGTSVTSAVWLSAPAGCVGRGEGRVVTWLQPAAMGQLARVAGQPAAWPCLSHHVGAGPPPTVLLKVEVLPYRPIPTWFSR